MFKISNKNIAKYKKLLKMFQNDKQNKELNKKD